MFFLVCKNLEQRTSLIQHLKENNILAVFHYISLHKSPFYKEKHDDRMLPETDKFTDCLLRLPLFFELENDSVVSVLLNYN
jgi:dTDP-4-amino-4,6-dideoxygalactose transaminase